MIEKVSTQRIMMHHAKCIREGGYYAAKLWWRELMRRKNPNAIRYKAKEYSVGKYGLYVYAN